MSIRDYKITDEQFNEKGMTSLPDTLNGTPYENKKSLEKFTREVVAPQFNAIVEVFAQMEESADNWSAEEAQRVQQENARQTAEQGRVSAEGQRVQSEKTRLSAESRRVADENARIAAETARVNAENKRDSAEKSRVSAETARNVWQTYDAAKTYVPGNKVSFGGSSYVCTAATIGHEPTDTAYWLLIAQKGMDGAGADDLRQINNALDAIDPTKITAKAAPADADGVMIADSVDGGKAKRLLWSSVKRALGKLFVPLARKINGKTLSADVTLTGDDIAMGADDAENLRAAMAKRPLAKETLTLAGDINAKSAFPRGKSLVFRTTDSDWDGNMPSEYAAYAKLRSSLSGSYDLWFGASDCRFWFARAGDDAIPARDIWYELARCIAPEVHSLPLNIAGDDSTCYYAKDQFGRVYVSIRTKLNANWNDYKIIGTLPEGFLPVWDVVTPLLIQNAPISYQIGQIVIQPGGNIYVRGSFTSAEYIFAQLTYPASV
jgi:hypothetical protein